MPCARTSSSRRSACTSSSSACSLTSSGLGPAVCRRCGGMVAAGPGAGASAGAGGASSPVRSMTSSAGCAVGWGASRERLRRCACCGAAQACQPAQQACAAGWGASRERLRRCACCGAAQACQPAQQANSLVDGSHLLPGTVGVPHEAAACKRCPAEQSAPRNQSDHDGQRGYLPSWPALPGACGCGEAWKRGRLVLQLAAACWPVPAWARHVPSHLHGAWSHACGCHALASLAGAGMQRTSPVAGRRALECRARLLLCVILHCRVSAKRVHLI
jgi:hypothetical protein